MVWRLLCIHIIGGFMNDLIPLLNTAVFKKGIEDSEVWPFLYSHLKRDEEVNRAKPVIHLRRPRRLYLHFLKTTIHIKRDTQPSIAYSEELIFSMSVTLQSTDRRHGIVG